MPNFDHDSFLDAVNVYEDANKKRDAGLYDEAMPLYEVALERLKGRLDLFVLYDMALANDFAGNAPEATACFEKCVAVFEFFQKENPEDERLFSWSNFVDGVREQLVMRKGSQSSDKDYLGYVRKSLWPAERFPLQVQIDDSAQTGFSPASIAIIQKAIDCWMQQLIGLRPDCQPVFSTGSDKNADIIISRGENKNPLTQTFGGQTVFEYADAGETTLSRARIFLYSATFKLPAGDNEGELAEIKRFYSLAMHEFGHALGIDGHSPFGDDLMYWKSNKVVLGERDIETVRAIYSKSV